MTEKTNVSDIEAETLKIILTYDYAKLHGDNMPKTYDEVSLTAICPRLWADRAEVSVEIMKDILASLAKKEFIVYFGDNTNYCKVTESGFNAVK